MSLAPACRPRLARFARLRTDPLTGTALLLYPERALKLNATAACIIESCNGELGVGEIAERVARAFPDAPAERVPAAVLRVLGDLSRRGLLLDADALRSAREPADPLPALDDAPLATAPGRPYTLIAELTYACPLRCAYCSNPEDFASYPARLTTDDWRRVFAEAAELGVVQLHLTGGEPALRNDLTELARCARDHALYVNLVTSGVTLTRDRVQALGDAGLSHVQLSFQDVDAVAAQRVAGRSYLDHKLAVAAWVKEAALALTVNVVLQRTNIERIPAFVALAEHLCADRLELAHVQYLGWALRNRAALLPSADQIEAARISVRSERARLAGRLEIVHVMPDYYSGRPRACMDGWAKNYVVVAPDGSVRPCHAAQHLGLETWNVSERSLREIWSHSPVFNAYRGDAWMLPPCRNCPERELDHAGCRCQAHALTRDARRADPACALAPDHGLIQAFRLHRSEGRTEFQLRAAGGSVQS
ncbi:MAG TPA: pyrroloquinoline quinone biosynthesis protein PqqE [Polyangiaceae bacterium]|nr:pyrroloquinoline quinone biosynthesis protein PqqE [Polyangiaceae bacterium]